MQTLTDTLGEIASRARAARSRERPISTMQRPLDSVLLFRVAQIATRLEAHMQFDLLVRASGAFISAAALAGILAGSSGVRADEQEPDSTDPRVQRGFEIAPVPLNLAAKDRALVGLGSYLVNATADCNGCHTASPQVEFAAGGNPYFGQPKVVNPSTYLGGGQDFGPLIPGTPHIVSRNLTPDKTGKPEGGRSFAEFR